MHKLLFSLLILLLSTNSYAHLNSKDDQLFETLFSNWTHAFNHKELIPSCALFAKAMVADYRGIPRKNYSAVCDGFKKIFKDERHRYQYRFKLHSVYRSGNLAAVRITWYLTLYENGKPISKTQDEGIDILEKNRAGKWEIVNYLSYEV